MTLVIAGEDCTDGEYNQLWEKLRKMVTKFFYVTHLYNQPLLFSYPWGIDKFDNYKWKVDCQTGWAADGQAEWQVNTQIDFARRNLRHTDTDRQQNRWTGG